LSVKASTIVWETQLKPDQKYILLALVDQANDEGYCVYRKGEEITRAMLAEKTCLSERTIQRQLAEMIERGLVEITRDASHHSPPEYRVRVDRLSAMNKIVRGDRLSPLDAVDNFGQGRQPVSPEAVSGETATTFRGDIDDSLGRHPRHSGETGCLPIYKVLDVKAHKGKRGNVVKISSRNPEAIASEKATAALKELTERIDLYRSSGTALAISDKISVSVIHNDLGGKDAALKLGPEELRDKFTQNYIRREKAQYVAGRR
jgi:hypothetical protein